MAIVYCKQTTYHKDLVMDNIYTQMISRQITF
jgi:hypothetical protein